MNSIGSVAVIGLGYIGLPTAAILATNGIRVVGVDINRSTVEAVNRGEVPFAEPDLSVYVTGAVGQGNLSASTETPESRAYIVAVPTPFKLDKSPDLSYIDAAARGIAPKLKGGELIILESTSPPGATQHLGEYLVELRPDLSLTGDNGRARLHLAHCPERVLPGRVMIELVTNDRIVGGITSEAALLAKELYEVFCQGEIHITDAATAEMAKLVENSYRDVNIAFANELSMICDQLDLNVWELIRLANHHPRVEILRPGPGVGGHCIAVDPWFIVDAAPEKSILIRAAREVNDAKPKHVVQKTLDCVKHEKVESITIFGLTFKPDIDDLRESPALEIAYEIARAVHSLPITIVEPHIEALPEQLRGYANLSLMKKYVPAESDLALFLVKHTQFQEMLKDEVQWAETIDACGLFANTTPLKNSRG
ncbi:UDP-N-acetyl-D-mannosamine dehydrogenase [Arthrobacter sp. H5]|uniref:UDP-N-acetyl-D-mannosamine dehydrogenase n=1 Tax=Arthrobacter sp. H5 TaxID=1267973 RepID=UPI0004B59686|nr:UDP-N-acetyl-D-mannosamine dehydrogenase [Arthrobacter sp. H5]